MMQLADTFHCLTCHKDYREQFSSEHHKLCGFKPTACTPICGKWFHHKKEEDLASTIKKLCRDATNDGIEAAAELVENMPGITSNIGDGAVIAAVIRSLKLAQNEKR